MRSLNWWLRPTTTCSFFADLQEDWGSQFGKRNPLCPGRSFDSMKFTTDIFAGLWPIRPIRPILDLAERLGTDLSLALAHGRKPTCWMLMMPQFLVQRPAGAVLLRPRVQEQRAGHGDIATGIAPWVPCMCYLHYLPLRWADAGRRMSLEEAVQVGVSKPAEACWMFKPQQLRSGTVGWDCQCQPCKV